MAATTWDSVYTSTGLSLGRNSTTAVCTNSTYSGYSSRSTTSQSTGLIYAEVTCVNLTSGTQGWFAGSCNGTAPYNNTVGATSDGISYRDDGTVFVNNASVGTWQGCNDGDI